MRKIDQTLCYKWLQEVWNQGNKNSIETLLTDDAVIHGLAPGKILNGIEDFKSYYDSMAAEFKNIQIDLVDVISEDDMESVLCIFNGTHAATGKKVSFQGQCLVRIRDGKIAEGWNNFDFMDMQRQLTS